MVARAKTIFFVITLSSAEGSVFPDGWLCYVKFRFMLSGFRCTKSTPYPFKS